jgi:hypothetical protein
MTRKNVLTRALTVFLPLLTSSLAQQPAPIQVRFSELYGKITIRGLEFSSKLLEADGKRVEILGYMAPPLKPRIEFFVLTKTPLATCPFCSNAADWPPDIVLIYAPKNREMVSLSGPLRVRGRLELGAKEDASTGFVSLIRVYADEVEAIKP